MAQTSELNECEARMVTYAQDESYQRIINFLQCCFPIKKCLKVSTPTPDFLVTNRFSFIFSPYQTILNNHLPWAHISLLKSQPLSFGPIGGLAVTIPTCICALLPAVMLEIVQQASFLMLSLELLSKYNRLGKALQLRIT